MNTMISRFANPGKKEKFIAAAGTSATALMPFIPMAFAAPAGSTTAKDLISKVLGIICDIFLGIGVLLLAWSVGMLFLAFKNDDADSKSRAMMMMIVSIVLIAFKTILGGVLKSAGTGFTIGEGIF